MCFRRSTSSCTKAHLNFWTTKATVNPSGLSAILLWKRWTPWTPWKVNNNKNNNKIWTSHSSRDRAHSIHLTLFFRRCRAGMGGDHYVKTDRGDTFARRSDTWMFQGHRDANHGLDRLHHSRSEGGGTGGEPAVWTEWPCQSTKTLLLHFNPTSQRKSSLLKWTACPLVFKESERNKRETGTKSLRDDGEKKRAKTVSWLRELYHICKPSGTLHKLISLCIVVTVLCRYHLCFCKIIYSAKMVLFFLLFFFNLFVILPASRCWQHYPFSQEWLAKIKAACIFFWPQHLTWIHLAIRYTNGCLIV